MYCTPGTIGHAVFRVALYWRNSLIGAEVTMSVSPALTTASLSERAGRSYRDAQRYGKRTHGSADTPRGATAGKLFVYTIWRRASKPADVGCAPGDYPIGGNIHVAPVESRRCRPWHPEEAMAAVFTFADRKQCNSQIWTQLGSTSMRFAVAVSPADKVQTPLEACFKSTAEVALTAAWNLRAVRRFRPVARAFQ